MKTYCGPINSDKIKVPSVDVKALAIGFPAAI